MSVVSSNEFKQMVSENAWLKEINCQSYRSSTKHLQKAFDRFFKKLGRFPKFKSRKDFSQSFEVPENLHIDFKAKKIHIPKFIKTKKCDNRIKFVLSRKVAKGKIGTATISKTPSNEYYVSFIVHTNEEYKKPIDETQIRRENSLGIDYGLKHFLNLSNSDKVDSPEYFKNGLKKLAIEQKKLSRKQKDSKRKEKQRIKVAKIHSHIANQRNDFLHKLSTKLIRDSQFEVFCIEDLNMKAMSKLWGRKVHDLSWYSFTSMLGYKALKYGKRVVKIGRFEPSSQICSHCGHRQKLSLGDRVYKCPECGTIMDRDTNAAINIRNMALRTFKQFSEPSGSATIGTMECNDRGDESSGLNGANCSNETIVNETVNFCKATA